MKNAVKIFFVAFSAAILFLYCGLWLFLPFILNSPPVMSKIYSFVELKSGLKLDTKGSHISISPDLFLNFYAQEISAQKNGEKLLNVDDFNIAAPLFKLNRTDIKAEYIYFKIPNNEKSEKKKTKFKLPVVLDNLPDIFIKNADVEFETGSMAHFDTINLRDGEFSLNMNLRSKFLNEAITISNADKIKISSKEISTEKLQLNFKKSKVSIVGGYYESGLNAKIKGENLPVYDIENLFITLKKYFSNKKNFLENFTNFSGTLDVDLLLNNEEITGKAVINKLSAQTVPLSVPMTFNKLIFNFDKNKIFMDSSGFLGGEPVNWDFYLTGLFSDVEISGSVKADLGENFAKKYIEGLHVKGFVGLNVDYLVHNGIVDVLYSAEIPDGNDIVYNGARLGLIQYTRSIHASTSKEGDVITLTNYDYSVKVDDKEEQIIYGNARFTKQNGKYCLDKITGMTKKNSPVSLLGFIENRLQGGFFNGNFEYDFAKNQLFGSIILENSRFKNFEITNAAIFSDNEKLSILAEGTFEGEIFNSVIELKNQLKKQFYIYNLDLFLKKYKMQKAGKTKLKPKFKPQNRLENLPRVTVEKFNLRLDEYRQGRIEIDNILLKGNVKDNVLYFEMPSTIFANGLLVAKGRLDYDDLLINVDFAASDIDADTAASQIFNLDKQFSGKTAAKLHLEGPLKPEFIKGKGSFEIKEGALLNVGNAEFVIKRAKRKNPFKFSLSDIVKIDSSITESKNSNINGNFDILGEQINNANIFLKNDALSLFIEGNYNIENGNSLLNIWGRYDRGIEHKISIFHIPIGWLLKFAFRINQAKNTCMEKLLKIPSVKTENTKEFNIGLEGNINNLKELKVILKGID